MSLSQADSNVEQPRSQDMCPGRSRWGINCCIVIQVLERLTCARRRENFLSQSIRKRHFQPSDHNVHHWRLVPHKASPWHRQRDNSTPSVVGYSRTRTIPRYFEALLSRRIGCLARLQYYWWTELYRDGPVVDGTKGQSGRRSRSTRCRYQERCGCAGSKSKRSPLWEVYTLCSKALLPGTSYYSAYRGWRCEHGTQSWQQTQ